MALPHQDLAQDSSRAHAVNALEQAAQDRRDSNQHRNTLGTWDASIRLKLGAAVVYALLDLASAVRDVSDALYQTRP